ncbi:hypothetical protein AB0908_25315 (plasmid) [Enterobacter hormaechei subsp. xiangfangensis]
MNPFKGRHFQRDIILWAVNSVFFVFLDIKHVIDHFANLGIAWGKLVSEQIQ